MWERVACGMQGQFWPRLAWPLTFMECGYHWQDSGPPSYYPRHSIVRCILVALRHTTTTKQQGPYKHPHTTGLESEDHSFVTTKLRLLQNSHKCCLNQYVQYLSWISKNLQSGNRRLGISLKHFLELKCTQKSSLTKDVTLTENETDYQTKNDFKC